MEQQEDDLTWLAKNADSACKYIKRSLGGYETGDMDRQFTTLGKLYTRDQWVQRRIELGLEPAQEQTNMDKSCETCKHDGGQRIKPSACTGCGLDEPKNWEPKEAIELNWIEWNGGECPVPKGHDVSVRYRDGDIRQNKGPQYICWRHEGVSSDIVAYFDHTAAEQPVYETEAAKADRELGKELKVYPAAEEEPKEWKPCQKTIELIHSKLVSVANDLAGGYRTQHEIKAFQHGMETQCNAVLSVFEKSQAEKEREEFVKSFCDYSWEKFGSYEKDKAEVIYEWLIESGMAKRLADKGE